MVATSVAPARCKPLVLNLRSARKVLAHHSRVYPPHATPAPTHSVEAGVLLPTRRNQGSCFGPLRNQGSCFVHSRIQGADSVHRANEGSSPVRWRSSGFASCPLTQQRVRLLSIDATRVRVSAICATRVRVLSIQGRFPRPDGAKPNPKFADVQIPNPEFADAQTPNPRSHRRAAGKPVSPNQPDSTPLSPSPVNTGPYQQVRKPLLSRRIRTSIHPDRAPPAQPANPSGTLAVHHLTRSPPTSPVPSQPATAPAAPSFAIKKPPTFRAVHANRCSQDGRPNDLTGASTGFPAP